MASFLEENTEKKGTWNRNAEVGAASLNRMGRESLTEKVAQFEGGEGGVILHLGGECVQSMNSQVHCAS